MLASASVFKPVAALLVLGVCAAAGGCGKGAYEERMNSTIFQLTKQALNAEQGGAPAEEGAAEGEAPAQGAAPAEEAPPAN